jgi:predicted Zn-dependent peptidase
MWSTLILPMEENIMDYKLSELKNGVKLLTVELPNLESATLTVWIAVGSRFEHKRHMGLSHFLEHMAFKGGGKYKTAQDVSLALDRLGAEYNAATANEWTNFYVKVRADKIEKGFEILSEMLLKPAFNKNDIERERGVILEEIAMEEDTPGEKIGNLFSNLIFSGNPLGWDIAGTPDTVKSLQRNDFVRYRGLHYVTDNMLITVAGGIKDKKIRQLSEKYFGGLEKGKREKAVKFVSKQRKAKLMVEYKKSEQAHFILGFLGYPRGDKTRYPEAMLSTILGSGMSSRLFNEIREKRGLAYAVSTSTTHYVDTGLFATYEGVSPKRIGEAIKVTLNEHFDISNLKKAITAEELKKAKEYIKGRIALSLENTLAVNIFFGQRALFLKEIDKPEEVFDKIDKVTLEDVHAVAKKIFRPERLSLAILGPYKNKEKFEKSLKI